MAESFFTITAPAQGTFKEKGSKFLAFAHPVTDSEQIKAILDGLKKEYFDASHHCYAWVLGADQNQFRAFDDGEPNHSAGDPILGQIRSKNLTNILVVVVRYFGGTKLGVSGLNAAYKTAASEALQNSIRVEIALTKRYLLNFEYHDTTTIMGLLKECHAHIISKEFNEQCAVTVDVKISHTEAFESKLQVLSAMGIPHRLTHL